MDSYHAMRYGFCAILSACELEFVAKKLVGSCPQLNMVMASLGEEMTEDEIDDMMKAADSNNDGQVDYEEFKRVMMST